MNVLKLPSASILLLTLLSSIFYVSADAGNPTEAEKNAVALKQEPTALIIPAEDNFLKRQEFKWYFGDRTLEIGGKIRFDLFAAKNVNLFNNDNPTDRSLIPGRVTFDLNTIYTSGKKKYGREVIKSKMTIRTKQTFGDPESVAATGNTTIKYLDGVIGAHSHPISRPILWARELWMEACLNDIFNFSASSAQKFTVGFFPFQLGRGISLGDAYTIDPDILGYYSPNAVDQFAPGFKFSGGLIKDGCLDYDIYIAILNNKAASFADTNAKIRGQQYGHLHYQARGPGVINWVAATRLIWRPCNTPKGKLSFEPYVLYDHQKEQKVEFVGDADSTLGTVGLAVEAKAGRFEFGMDCAQNFGGQDVKGWDRNIIQFETRKGFVVEVNSQVTAINDNPATGDIAGKKAVFGASTQETIDDQSVRNEDQNGLQIGSTNFKNSNRRFSNPYTNKYRGFMFVADASYDFCEDAFKMAIAGGIATGDDNPNADVEEIGDSNVSGDYKGFISLQELYSGKRVKSAFVLSGAGKLPRLLSFPANNLDDRFARTVNRFTNLILCGWGATIEFGNWKLNPNILSYWQQFATRRFDLVTQAKDPVSTARPWLGIEYNLFADWMLFDDMRVFLVTSAFVPGTHYSDVKGQPITAEQRRYLDRLNRTGTPGDYTPLLGNDPGFSLNVGFEYKF